jgi:hypothetical protein
MLILGVLILTVCSAVYFYLAQAARPTGAAILDEDFSVQFVEQQRLVTLLTILLISALLILLFVVGAYLLINVGRFVARERVGGRTTTYVDAWREYRLTDEQISAATHEEPPAEPGPGSGSGSGSGPGPGPATPPPSPPPTPRTET